MGIVRAIYEELTVADWSRAGPDSRNGGSISLAHLAGLPNQNVAQITRVGGSRVLSSSRESYSSFCRVW